MNTFTTRIISNVNNFNIESVQWKTSISTIDKGSQKVTLYRAIPYVRSPTGEDSPLLLETDKVFTYGVKEQPKIDGEGYNYSIPLSLLDMNNPTEHQKNFCSACSQISEHGKKFLLKNKESFNKDWIESDLRKVSVIWHGKDNKRPTLYAKLPVEKGNISCEFRQPYLKNGSVQLKKVDPLLFKDIRCHVRAILRIESIFIGSQISFQTKIEEILIFPPPKRETLFTMNSIDIEGLEEGSESDTEHEESKDERQDELEFLGGGGSGGGGDSILEPLKNEEVIEPRRVSPVVKELPKARRGRKIQT
jgi:hypothetical protein